MDSQAVKACRLRVHFHSRLCYSEGGSGSGRLSDVGASLDKFLTEEDKAVFALPDTVRGEDLASVPRFSLSTSAITFVATGQSRSSN